MFSFSQLSVAKLYLSPLQKQQINETKGKKNVPLIWLRRVKVERWVHN